MDILLEQVVGPLLTALAMLGVDRFLDKRLAGPRPTVVGAVPFWWIFAWALPAGLVGGMVGTWGHASTTRLLVGAVGTLVLVALAIWATRRRFGW